MVGGVCGGRCQLVVRHDVPPLHLDRDGAYWITGGLGGLGLIFAEALVSRGAPDRSQRPERDGYNDQTGLAILSDRPARTSRSCRGDVGDRADVATLVANVEQTVGPLRHHSAAGVLDDAFILGRCARGDRVLRPKIDGTTIIDAATAHLDLQFLMLCSSVASVFGNAGQGAYAGANAFVDAFAEQRGDAVARGERRGVTRAIAWPSCGQTAACRSRRRLQKPCAVTFRHRAVAKHFGDRCGCGACWPLPMPRARSSCTATTIVLLRCWTRPALLLWFSGRCG